MRAAVFVDYEHWYISMTKLHGDRPNIKSWMREVSRKYDVRDISFFGDFSNPSLAAEILRIRAVTNNIIQTSNTGSYKKDFTDFIMLDHIYQKAMFSNDIDAFIIFSGDGHFSSAASCLKNNCGKEVGIFGVKDAFSKQLKEIADWYIEVPTELDIYEKYFDMIFTNIKEVEKTGKAARPSFAKTVEHVSSIYGVSEEKISGALNVLIDRGYAKRREVSYGRKKLMVLDFDWDKIETDEIWVKDPNLKKKEPEKETAKPQKKAEPKEKKNGKTKKAVVTVEKKVIKDSRPIADKPNSQKQKNSVEKNGENSISEKNQKKAVKKPAEAARNRASEKSTEQKSEQKKANPNFNAQKKPQAAALKKEVPTAISEAKTPETKISETKTQKPKFSEPENKGFEISAATPKVTATVITLKPITAQTKADLPTAKEEKPENTAEKKAAPKKKRRYYSPKKAKTNQNRGKKINNGDLKP